MHQQHTASAGLERLLGQRFAVSVSSARPDAQCQEDRAVMEGTGLQLIEWIERICSRPWVAVERVEVSTW